MEVVNIPTYLGQDESSESAKLQKKLKELSGEFYITGMTDKLKLKMDFRDCFESLYKQSYHDNYFWQYCPFNVYESTLINRQD